MSAREGARGPAPGFTGFDEEEDEGSLSWRQIRHLVHAPLRRPLMVLVPWGAILVLAIAILFVLPKQYRSTTLILVESEKVPDSFVPKVATEDNFRRIENIRDQS